MLKVGLTGGIASGKSTISQLFSNLGVSVIDTDVISHQLMQKGQPAYLHTVQHFGPDVLNKDGSLNRPLLRKIIFDQPQQKQWLEEMIHPLIRQQTNENISQLSNGNYVLIVVPLMFESGFNNMLDHIIAIDCPAQVQQKRLTQRDNINDELAQKMITSQIDNSSRLAQADSIIHNFDNEDRSREIFQLHQKLLKLAQQSKFS